MTTLEPGASVVFTHGWLDRPRSTAFLATSAAATITDGLDVLVQDVIAAMATAPWSRSNSTPSAVTTRVGLDGRLTAAGADSDSAAASSWSSTPGTLIASEAGKVSDTDSS